VRKLLVGVALLVVRVIAVALVIPFVVPVEGHQGRVIALVGQATGRDFRIAGPVRLALLPELGVEANDVSFANPAGAGTPAMVQLRRPRVQLRLWTLLRGAVVVNRVVLLRPVMALEADNTGHANGMFGPAAAPDAPHAPLSPHRGARVEEGWRGIAESYPDPRLKPEEGDGG
jgi:AsmA protein